MSCRGNGSYSNTTSSSVKQALGSNGRISNLIHARPLIEQRNFKIQSLKKRQGLHNTNMTLAEYKFSHYVHLDDSYKPCALCTTDQCVTNAIGTTGFGETIEFLMNEIGDFQTNVSAVVDLPEVQCEEADLPNIVVYSKYQAVNDLNTGKPLDFGAGALGLTGAAATIPDGHVYYMLAGVPQNTTFTNADGLEYTIAPGGIRYTYTDGHRTLIAGPDGTAVFPNANGFGNGGQAAKVKKANYVRAVRFPGIKIFNDNIFMVDEKPIQEYDSLSVLNDLLYNTGNHVKPLLYNLYGEDIGHWEKNHLMTVEGKSFANITGPDALASTGHNVQVHDGLQTPKLVHKCHQLLIPTPFTFSKDISKSLCMAALPDTPKKIQYKSAYLDDIFRPTFGDLFIHEEVTAQPSTAGVINPVTDQFSPVLRTSRLIPFLNPGSGIIRDCCKNMSMRLLSTCFYVDDYLHEMFVAKVGFDMIRIPVVQEKSVCYDCTCRDNTEDIQLYSSRWPTEYLVPRLIPQINRKKEHIHYLDNWFEDAHVCNYLEYLNYTREYSETVGPVTTYYHEIKSLKTYIRSRKIDTLRSLGLRVLAYDYFNQQNVYYYKYLHPYERGVDHFQSLFRERQAPFLSFQYKLFDPQVDNICNFSKARESYLALGLNHHGYKNCNKCVCTSPVYTEECCDKNCFCLHIYMISINFTVRVSGNYVVRFS